MADITGPDGGSVSMDIPPAELEGTVAGLLAVHFRLALVAAHDDGERGFRVVYLFTSGPPDRRLELHVPVDRHHPTVPSLAHLSFPASRFEREMRDLFGIEPIGHPMARRLVLHQHWPEDWHPMRHDAGPPPVMVDDAAPYPFVDVEGAGVYEIPVGPVHAGLIEPGHFRFSVVGETIVRMKARLWFVHKGIERLFEGRDAWSAVDLAERISGDSAVCHSLAYCQAFEEASGLGVSSRTQELRAVLLELERLYNHVADIGALCNDVGFGLAQARALILRERLLRLNADVSGHRLLRNGITPGGASLRRLPRANELAGISTQVHDLVDLALSNTIVVDRFTGTAVLPINEAREIGVLGVVARASGMTYDARYSHPFLAPPAEFSLATHETGDVLARFLVRRDEIGASLSLLAELTDRDGPLEVSGSRPDKGAVGSGSGIVEGWRGTVVHRLEIDSFGTLRRVKVVDPSFFNWPALSVALADTIVPDFPLANKSFNLSYAGNDL